MVRKLLFIMIAFLAAVPLRADDNNVIFFDNSESKYDQVYIHWWDYNGNHSDFPGYKMTHLGNDIWVYINNGDIWGTAQEVNFNNGKGNNEGGKETNSIKLSYGTVFDNSTNNISGKTVPDFYAIHGTVINGGNDWRTYPLVPDGDKWITTQNFIADGLFGIKKLNQQGKQLTWYNYSGLSDSNGTQDDIKKANIASDQNATLDVVGQNFRLVTGGSYTFVFTPGEVPVIGFYSDYIAGGSDPVDPDPVEPTAIPLYVVHQSWASNTNEWGSTEPRQMAYDEKTKTYTIHVDGSGGFGLSRTNVNGASGNWAFWNGDNLFRPRTTAHDDKLETAQNAYVHFNEPDYYNAEHGAKPDANQLTSPWNNDNFYTHASGTLKVKYDTGNGIAKIWYTPDNYPDLYIMGAIIAPKDAIQPNPGSNDGTNQWNTVEKMEKYDKKPGVYYYDLGIDEEDGKFVVNESKHFNLNSFKANANRNGDVIDEIGHFNFSLSGTNPNSNTPDGGFWADPFAPANGGMHELDRNGTPASYVYRDSDPGRDYQPGAWASTNFVFKERCRIWADVNQQIVWVELRDKDLTEDEILFTFWDKRGDKYPADRYDYLRWWDSDPAANDMYKAELVVFADNDPQGKEIASFNLKTEEGNPWTSSVHSVKGVTDGIYHGVSVSQLDTELVEAAKAFVKGDADNFKNYLWVRISDVNHENSGAVILRPYVEGAVYTQAINDSGLDNSVYGDVTESEMTVTMTPDLRVIPNSTEAQRMTGGFNDDPIVYPAVNQYQTLISFNDPFTVVGGEVTFNKSYSIQGYVGGTKFSANDESGTMTQIRLTGINHTDSNLDELFDKVFVEISYVSDGMSFTRSYERFIPDFDWKDEWTSEEDKDAHFELPVMNYGADENDQPSGKVLDTTPRLVDNAEGDGQHYVVDLILHKKFTFRDEMINSRAAYIRYTIEDLQIDADGDGNYVPYEGACLSNHGLSDEEIFAAQNGIPLTREIEGLTSFTEEWYKEAFLSQQLDIEIPHVLCADEKADLSGKVKGKIVYELIVPVADEVKAYFEEDASASKLARRRVADGPEVDNYVPGYDDETGYNGSLSAPSDDNDDNIANKYKDELVFEYVYTINVPTGVENIDVADENAETEYEYFNLQGIRLNSANLAPGIYLRRASNGTIVKIYVK